MTNKPAAIFRATAELLRRDGWIQDLDTNADGNRCLVQALDTICASQSRKVRSRYHTDILDPLRKTLREQWGWNESAIDWNDEPGRTAEEVITLLEQTAEKLEADETMTE
jgi:hypothetical protein